MKLLLIWTMLRMHVVEREQQKQPDSKERDLEIGRLLRVRGLERGSPPGHMAAVGAGLCHQSGVLGQVSWERPVRRRHIFVNLNREFIHMYLNKKGGCPSLGGWVERLSRSCRSCRSLIPTSQTWERFTDAQWVLLVGHGWNQIHYSLSFIHRL